MTGDVGVWLYAVMRTDDAPVESADLTGVAGESPHPVPAGDLTAVVGPVPLAVFGDEPLRRNLEDLDWLEATARAHDAVISALSRHGPVVPLRLATVFLDEDRVVRLLTDRHADFASVLTLVSGRTEWGVKVFCDPAALAAAVAGAATAATGGGAGTAYLARRRAQLAARETVERDAAARAEDIHTQLVRRAAAGRCQPLTDPVLHGHRDRLILNGTYLVDDARAADFAAAVAELDRNSDGIRLELTGPWPPYSFTVAERASS